MKGLICGLLFVLLVVSGCSTTSDPRSSGNGSYKASRNIKARIAEDRYHSPKTNFSCAIPSFLGPGAVIRDHAEKKSGWVTFEDDKGGLMRVDFMNIQSERPSEAIPPKIQRALAGALFSDTVDCVYRPSLPGTKVLHAEYVALQNGTNVEGSIAMFGVVLLPKGSTLYVASGRRLDALHASLSFVKGHYLYRITTQEPPTLIGLGTGSSISAGECQRLREKLEAFYATFSFD